MINFDKFQESLHHLEAQFKNYTSLDERSDLSALDREAIAESVVHRFETCYDTLWKHRKRFLVEGLGLPEVPNSPKPVFRLAPENALLPSATEVWLGYADARTATAHDYSGKKAEQCLKIVDGFLVDARTLLNTLREKSPE